MPYPWQGQKCDGSCGGTIQGPLYVPLKPVPADAGDLAGSKYAKYCSACFEKPEAAQVAPFHKVDDSNFDAPTVAALLRSASAAPDRKADRAAVILDVAAMWTCPNAWGFWASPYGSGLPIDQVTDLLDAYSSSSRSRTAPCRRSGSRPQSSR